MKKILLLLLSLLLLNGCQKNDNYKLMVDSNSMLKCFKLIYTFDDGTRVYSMYEDIKYKTDNMEIPISEAIEKKYIKLSDLENNDNFKIYKFNETVCPSCC